MCCVGESNCARGRESESEALSRAKDDINSLRVCVCCENECLVAREFIIGRGRVVIQKGGLACLAVIFISARGGLYIL